MDYPQCNYQIYYWIVEKGNTYLMTAVRFETRIQRRSIAWDMPEIIFLIWSTLFLKRIVAVLLTLVGEHYCALWLWHSQPGHCTVNVPNNSFLPLIKWKKGRDSQESVIVECLCSKTHRCLSSGSVNDVCLWSQNSTEL